MISSGLESSQLRNSRILCSLWPILDSLRFLIGSWIERRIIRMDATPRLSPMLWIWSSGTILNVLRRSGTNFAWFYEYITSKSHMQKVCDCILDIQIIYIWCCAAIQIFAVFLEFLWLVLQFRIFKSCKSVAFFFFTC